MPQPAVGRRVPVAGVVPGRQRGQRRQVGVDVRDLAVRVHPGVGPAGDDHPHLVPQHRLQCVVSTPATVRSPGWTAHPAKSVPS